MNMSHLFLKRSRIDGTGLHTKKLLRSGEKVGLIHGKVEIVRKWTPLLSKISPNWIGIGRYSWINTKESPFRHINHSCSPNTYIVGKRTVVALRDIAVDEELTMDYSFTEADPGWSIPRCKCGSKQCRRIIGPIYSLDKKTFQKNKSLIAENFRNIFLTEKKRTS